MIHKRNTHLKKIQNLTLPLTHLKGVGPKRVALMAQRNIHTILDLLFFIPIRYEDRTRIWSIQESHNGQRVQIKGKVLSGREERSFPIRKRLFKICIEDGGPPLELLWFNYRKPHLSRYTSPGMELLAYGTIVLKRGKHQMIHPEIIDLDSRDVGDSLCFYPVYSWIQGISPNLLRSMIGVVLDSYLPQIVDPMPQETRHRLKLPSLHDAIEKVHRPGNLLSLDQLNAFNTSFHRRLAFDRFFLVMLAIAFRKRSRERSQGVVFPNCPDLLKKIENCFPFDLTLDQRRTLERVSNDLARGRPMNRLLLGDVGCGKTVIAASAASLCAQNGKQTALMAPTQVLANQHFEYFSSLSEKMGFNPVLLTSGLKKTERQDAYDRIRSGKYNLIIGTQSLIQQRLSFYDLGLVVIDEQHRFGVRQRALIDRKGRNSHLLVMTATPIPRTLAITVYGDMDISMIKTYPGGRMPVITKSIPVTRKIEVFESVREKMPAGEQIFVICPVIEGSEDIDLKNAVDMADSLKRLFSPRFKIGLIHGRLPSDEKARVMHSFRKGQIHLLVGTTVIEVGVHVPKATVMIIEHPERFGLAQLHQLRGRVGRGAVRGTCFLMESKNLSQSAKSRLKILENTHDGFEIAQKDLELRGQGELTGMRQAGMGELDLSELMRDPDLLLKAKEEAQYLVDADPGLSQPEHKYLQEMVESILSRPIDL